MPDDRTNNFEITFWKKLLTERTRINANRLQNWDAIKFLSLVSTPIIADAMDGRNVIEALCPVLQGGNVTGPALTVKTKPWDWGTVITAIESARVGDVILIESAGSNTAVWGGLASLAAQNRGVVGSIIYGACRDTDVIKELKFPVWAKSVTPRAGKPLNEGQINIPITIGESTVEPNDIIRADAVGVVFVPSQNVNEVALKVDIVLKKEKMIEEGLKRGRNFSELI
ncbi:MAG TPA: RraA family protein [Candidatus Acidoferrales bacterium]|nr:RraA family protein [Candidatus Acidoferrales bacterium]